MSQVCAALTVPKLIFKFEQKDVKLFFVLGFPFVAPSLSERVSLGTLAESERPQEDDAVSMWITAPPPKLVRQISCSAA